MGVNATEIAGNILHKTGEAAQKIGEGATGVLGNITEEIKVGVSGNLQIESRVTDSKITTLALSVPPNPNNLIL